MQLPSGVTEADVGEWEVRSELSASGSVRAPSQHGSICSSRMSTMLATAKAKAQAATTKAAFSEREMALKLQKAESQLQTAKAEAELEALRCRKEMEAGIAEAAVLQAELDDDNTLREPSMSSKAASHKTSSTASDIACTVADTPTSRVSETDTYSKMAATAITGTTTATAAIHVTCKSVLHATP
ncbi:hypothetical protein PAMP_022889 [Pampus punctatissimus]